jgi:hypothetical protein
MSRVIKFIRIVSLRKICFATEQERYAFYMQYARAPGFRSKKHKNKAMSCVYVYSRQGSSEFYKEGEKRKRAKMSKRTGCMA